MQAAFVCQACGFKKQVKSELIGKKAKCPSCAGIWPVVAFEAKPGVTTLPAKPRPAASSPKAQAKPPKAAVPAKSVQPPVSAVKNKRSVIMKAAAAISGAASVLYLINPTAGIIELIPDNFMFVGNLDEVAAAVILMATLRFLGLDLTKKFASS